MKVSFSIPSAKRRQKRESVSNFEDPSCTTQNDAGASKQFIAEFDPSKPVTLSGPKTLIPPIPNQWKPLKKMKNLHLPTTADFESLKFKMDSASEEAAETEG
ncbi:hypothetical protein VNO78_03120 [Psophocarpus tetragonolobus]|uniref:Uncharacterized protein n=1 Tax=Psophocarpus tetragonolobus TaxID=3891 RepID=A0AAN9T2K0_PSOTE